MTVPLLLLALLFVTAVITTWHMFMTRGLGWAFFAYIVTAVIFFFIFPSDSFWTGLLRWFVGSWIFVFSGIGWDWLWWHYVRLPFYRMLRIGKKEEETILPGDEKWTGEEEIY